MLACKEATHGLTLDCCCRSLVMKAAMIVLLPMLGLPVKKIAGFISVVLLLPIHVVIIWRFEGRESIVLRLSLSLPFCHDLDSKFIFENLNLVGRALICPSTVLTSKIHSISTVSQKSYGLALYIRMWFCPLDGTLLKVQESGASSSSNGESNFVCSTCPYSCPIDRPRSVKTCFSKRIKQVDDILGGAAAWDNVDRTMATCPNCNHKEAYFMQMQIRSADEPSSIFYKCCKCSTLR